MKQHYSFLLSLLLLTGSVSELSAQAIKNHLIYFTDKNDSPYSLDQPEAYLSERAIARRQKQNIPISIKDIPVNAAYVSQVATHAPVLYTTRWMNGAMVSCNDSVLNVIRSLPFVLDSERLNRVSVSNVDRNQEANTKAVASVMEDYGMSSNQIEMMDAHTMHDQGFKGEGKIIAVLDAGFPGVDMLQGFSHIYQNNRMLGTYDFVTNSTNVYGYSSHGTSVLSCIAAYLPGQLIGTAPEASFYLFRTEDAATETRSEEAYWLFAVEKADSLGVDVINSSLGYNTFDDSLLSYTVAQMDGNTALISRAADLAAATGVLVVTSAGNSGNDSSWQGKITAPGDADSIITVGAVNSSRTYVSFSSRGPTADGRIKPDLSAKGGGTTVLGPDGSVYLSNGTSFSSPLLCGFAAAVWQADPDLTNIQLIDYLQKSGSQASNPDTLLGYGIPSFTRFQTVVSVEPNKVLSGVALYPTIVYNQPLQMQFTNGFATSNIEAVVYDINGKLIYSEVIAANTNESTLKLPVNTLKGGMYFVKFNNGKSVISAKFIKG